MNERIRELAEQADEYARGQSILYDTWKKIYSKKFAELIVRESIEVLKQNDYHGEWLGEKIKEHFGVEE